MSHDPYIYVCGCVRTGSDWQLCDDCSSRIGVYGTCPECSGPANEQWISSAVPITEFCSGGCADRAALMATVD